MARVYNTQTSAQAAKRCPSRCKSPGCFLAEVVAKTARNANAALRSVINNSAEQRNSPALAMAAELGSAGERNIPRVSAPDDLSVRLSDQGRTSRALRDNDPLEIESITPEADFGDGALVLQLKANDSRAYERVMRELGPRLLATAMRMLGNEDDAKEAVQDAFLSAFRNMQNFDGKSKLSTWLHRIVINACLMKLRTKRRKPSVSIETLLPKYNDEGHMELPIQSWRRGETGSEEGTPDESLRQRVREEIEDLPEEYRTVLMLRDVEDLDTAETAVVLGVTESAVKTRLHRARQALRAKLDAVVRSEGGTR